MADRKHGTKQSTESFTESVSNSLTRLKNSLRRHLSQQWTELTSPSFSVPASKLPEPLAHHATEVSTSTIPESVVAEIAESLNLRGKHAHHHAATDQESENAPEPEDGSQTAEKSDYNFDSSRHLPLGARFKPRGVFEDDWSARPSANKPWPVILIHGTVDTKGVWQELGTELRADGWCVFAPDYGRRGTAAMEESAVQLGAYIEAVRTITGAEKVILIGHSQGGLLARYWMRTSGQARYVKHLVSLGAPNHGTTMGGILSPLVTNNLTENIMHSLIHRWFGPVGFQQITGSEIFAVFNDDGARNTDDGASSTHGSGELEDGVDYTCIASRQDTVVQPPETCFLNGPAHQVRNVWVQDIIPRANVQHQDLPMNKHVRAIIRTGLKKGASEANLKHKTQNTEPKTRSLEHGV
ncbi:triacylglycerol lipase [Corynebacterium pseudodiphtheriticum]|uniref:esterase/lipase family protein n=1 Tax=Corynebacterium pseudodiphtheriticum TaxID=37637 RepID=UPI00254AFABA|nr:triacylglycerol lipase [Corynebacterium pseudodiphtheriticum]MDK8487149.1 triacylglycerol lipase [Corynebacterium pseudodiphtheriticum]MDK8494482.1 triacylglycerol lipase [Corynebacterium pseudodiphtheriticum]MDK8500602.1 triacylglycerol lipase [Corynebacterium pseudodiphtheriticum]MDK8546126.1 triacylglycerol lipase [Corynebacterium pseudodiphtheriticum]MDK8583642.1 triacylglycerol lipase [Corynebacterium pseudodiphtheriticum]